MWLIANYQPVAAFSLRPSNTTSSGGKSLLAPTAYAFKMALLDRMIRHRGLAYARDHFTPIRELTIWLRPPRMAVVNRTFQKILRPGGDPWKNTIAMREYVFQSGFMTLAPGPLEPDLAEAFVNLLPSINYFGRKGGFMQFAKVSRREESPAAADGFINLCRESETLSFGFLQCMDDMRPDATFADISTVEQGQAHGGRASHNVIFPYRLVHHAFNHSIYELERVP